MNKIGQWISDKDGLPCFAYEGKLPYQQTLSNGTAVKLPEDPWFLLGNYRLTLFTHVSGEYELISGERAWVRINQGERINSGSNISVLTVGKKEISLVGMDSLAADPSVCKRTFGCGFAQYEYETEGVQVTRKMSVKPSPNPYEGTADFVCEVTIKNVSGSKVTGAYTEGLNINYTEISYQGQELKDRKVTYRNHHRSDPEQALTYMEIEAVTEDPLLLADKEEMSLYECFPPVVFMKDLLENTRFVGDDDKLSAKSDFELQPGEEVCFSWLMGLGYDTCENTVAKALAAKENSKEWKDIIPDFSQEADADMRRELQWHVYNLEAMATYSAYYQETKIPQGTIYDYEWGAHASARDNFQHGLPLVYYNQPLAKSVLRYMLKRTTPFGEIRLIEKGYAYSDNERYFTSDQQLYFFLLLSEYLRVTKKYAFLLEEVQPYPMHGISPVTVWEQTKRCFTFLRDTVGCGEHGLVRLLNSDWNDAVYYIEKIPYNTIFFTGESHMNSAMAISILQNLIPQLKTAKEVVELPKESACVIESMELYRSKILEAFMKDLGERSFPRRMYFNGKPYGDDNMFLEPLGFTLQIEELSMDAKKQMYAEMQKRVYNGEKLGAREQQAPEFEDVEFDKGSRENGGFWWALNGPVIVAMNQIDKEEAKRLLQNMTLKHCAEAFPEYWCSYWSSADNLESSLIPEEGLADQSLNYWRIPVYCAHPHAWILYCWYQLLNA